MHNFQINAFFAVTLLASVSCTTDFYRKIYAPKADVLNDRLSELNTQVLDSNEASAVIVGQNKKLLKRGELQESLLRRALKALVHNKQILFRIIFAMMLLASFLYYRTSKNSHQLSDMHNVLDNISSKVYKSAKNHSKINIYLLIIGIILCLCLLLFLGKFIF